MSQRSTGKYHPFRYAQTRPHAKELVQYWMTAVGDKTHLQFETVEKLQNVIMPSYNKTLSKLPVELRPKTMDLAFEELNRATSYLFFVGNGRNIFDFENKLVSLFKKTDVGDVPVTAIRLPYNAQYIGFGRQDDLELVKNRFVDGAYLYTEDGPDGYILHIELTTTSPNENLTDETGYVTCRDWCYHFQLSLEEGRSIDLVLDAALKNELNLINPELTEEQKSELPGSFSTVINDSSREGKARRAAQLETGYETFRTAMNLVVNGLFYLTAHPDENSLEWPKDAPSSLTEKVEKAQTPKQEKRARSKLLPLGFTQVRFCRLPTHYAGSSTENGLSPKQHWRRGHWRNQPHGPERSLRKLIWILPVLVGSKEELEPESLGHIYSVG